MRRAVDFANSADLRQWLAALSTNIEDMIDLGHEASRKKDERVMSRTHLRGEIERTGATLRNLLRAGRRGLPPKKPTPH